MEEYPESISNRNYENLLNFLDQNFDENPSHVEDKKILFDDNHFNFPSYSETQPEPDIPDDQTLLNLIQIIETSKLIRQQIKHPKLLLQSLKELNSLIGLTNLKISIAKQVTSLILNLDQRNPMTSNQQSANSKPMLSAFLYGKPGVGKTEIGLILAKIWYSLGFLENSRSFLDKAKSKVKSLNPMLLNTIIPFLFFMTPVIISGFLKFLGPKLGTFKTILLGIVLLLIIIIAIWYWITSSDESDISNKNSSGRDIISVVSRNDFIGQYVGSTSEKTKNLLDSNRGKVLFIDEAYSLHNGTIDPFGDEALTTLNLYLSEHPGEIIVIFAGYRDLMEERILKNQPGLARRALWHFSCDDYSPQELAQIFLQQMEKSNISLQDSSYAVQLIEKNYSSFPSFGGDTQRLVEFCKHELLGRNLRSSNLNSNSNSNSNSKISNSELLKSFQQYQKQTKLF